MADEFMTDDENEDLSRRECPECRKAFDVAGNKWQREALVCPFCAAEIDDE